MRRFAAAGHRVFYLELQTRSTGAPYLLTEREPNLWSVSLSGPALEVYRGALTAESVDALLASLDALRRDFSLGATAALVQLPFWWPLARQARDRWNWRLAYDCMDDHRGFSTNTDTMVGEEDRIFREADVVVVSSAVLEARARARGAVNPVLIRNACDYHHFARPVRPRRPRPVIGYYGAIADWFDADLIADVATARPDWDFVLVGSTFTGDVERLGKLPNVTLPGEKPYSEIPELARAVRCRRHSVQALAAHRSHQSREGLRDAGRGQADRRRAASRGCRASATRAPGSGR